MKTPMEKVESMLTAKEAPSYDDLEAALAQCLQEREAFYLAAKELTACVSKMAFARLKNDELMLHQTLDAYIAKAVVPYLPADVDVSATQGMVH